MAWKPPGWGKKPRYINGVAQYGRANPNSKMPYYGGLFRNLLAGGGQQSVLNFGGRQDAAPQQQGNPIAGILADYMNQARADFGAQSSAEKGDMINAIRKYIISYGGPPELAELGKDAQGYLKQAMDAKTLGLARKAEEEGLSARARLGQGNQRAVRLIPAALAARGMLRSGQTGSDLSDQAMQYKQSGYDMLNEMLGAITGSVSQYQNAERERQRQLAEMQMQMAMQAASDWGGSYFDGDGGGGAGGVPDYGRPTPTRSGTRRVGRNIWNPGRGRQVRIPFTGGRSGL